MKFTQYLHIHTCTVGTHMHNRYKQTSNHSHSSVVVKFKVLLPEISCLNKIVIERVVNGPLVGTTVSY